MEKWSPEELRQLFAVSKEWLTQQEDLFGSSLPAVKAEAAPAIISEKQASLSAFHEQIAACMSCKLGAGRKNLVFGSGNADAGLMVIGEGPGADEDESGYPFVGRAGQLLTAILKAIQFSRQDVYIANIVKCRPPKNRAPEPDEVGACINHLNRQIEIIQPKIILALGATAATSLLGKGTSLGDFRGKVHHYRGIPVVVTYHPAALLRDPNRKPATWEDVKFLRKLYDSAAG